jgi:UDP-N-acetyl-D-galactosamine dehydrogenase
MTVKELIRAGKAVRGARILVLGLTFKENVPDIRNSKVVDILAELAEYGVTTLVHDPHADAEETRHEYGLTLTALEEVGTVDGVILAVAHRDFADFGPERLRSLCGNGQTPGIVIDVKSLLSRGAVEAAGLRYWSL